MRLITRETTARLLVLGTLFALPLVILGYQHGLRPLLAPHRIIDIIAAAPEAGGFQPDSIQVQAGETVTLRFFSPDVTHGIAIGPGLGIDLGAVDPGRMKEVTIAFDHAGTFTFYCNTWCSRDHWRMRGVISVIDEGGSSLAPARDMVIENLIAEGVDIDAAHMGQTGHEQETQRSTSNPSPERGALLLETLSIPPDLHSIEWRRTHTLHDAITLLRHANPEASEQDLTDVAAALWLSVPDTTGETVRLYEQNCAACHGENGDGQSLATVSTASEPAVFADFDYMLHMRSDVLYAKIRRGGMGTDMPNFGTLFTPEETWALVDYLWQLSLEEE